MARRKIPSMMWERRKAFRELRKLGVTRPALHRAVLAIRGADEWPTGKDANLLPEMIAAEVIESEGLPAADGEIIQRIIELIEALMPLIEAWIQMCGV